MQSDWELYMWSFAKMSASRDVVLFVLCDDDDDDSSENKKILFTILT